MKILHVISHADYNGCTTHLVQLSRFLNQTEFENTVVCLSHGYIINKLKELNVTHTVIDRNSYSATSIARQISKIAEYIGADLIHCHDQSAANLSLMATYRLKLPFIYNIHCWAFHKHKSLLRRQLSKLNERFIMQQATYNVLPSPTNLKDGQREFSVPNSVVIPHGVDTNEFDPDRLSTLTKKIYGIPDNYTVVGFLARLCQKKDPLTLIRAAALALKEERKLHFLIVGDGVLKDSCLAETKKLGIENNVSFQDINVDVPSLLKIFDIYCMPSQWEGLSIGLLEAMAMKKAIITSPVNANVEVIADYTDGMLVSAGKPEDWKNAILEFHQNPRLREDLGRQARLLVERYYDIHKSVNSHAALYRRLIPDNEEQPEEEQPEKVLYSIQ